jgi:hypothetical protein
MSERIKPTDEDADFKMMSDPDQWPVWPMLPLKNKQQRGAGNMARLGVLINPYLRNNETFFVPDKLIFERIKPEDLAPENVVSHENMRSLIEQGWVVDG